MDQVIASTWFIDQERTTIDWKTKGAKKNQCLDPGMNNKGSGGGEGEGGGSGTARDGDSLGGGAGVGVHVDP